LLDATNQQNSFLAVVFDRAARGANNAIPLETRPTLRLGPGIGWSQGGCMASDKALVGAAGEHLVLSRLLSRGLLAAPAPRGTEKVDIVVTNQDGKSSFRIQVKTTEGSTRNGWFLNAKHESQSEPDLYFCFVLLRPTSPQVFVVPSSVVAAAIQADHKHWLEKPSRSGKPHSDSAMRRIRSSMPLMEHGWLDCYLERWDQIG